MSFATEAAKSVNDARILVEIDITPVNEQWVNNGAGIWAYNLDVNYPWVDDSLLDADWISSALLNVGSVLSDGANLVGISDTANLTPLEYVWDAANKDLYVCIQNYNDPHIHDVRVGLIFGFSYDEFTPSGMLTPQPYEGRLTGVPRVTLARDPLFFGKIRFGGGSISINNMDGEFDTFVQDNNVYGNEARVFIGFADLDYGDYERVFTGYIDSVNVSEETISFAISDRRKQLTRPIQITATAQNPVTMIRDILTTSFQASFDTDFFDTTAWNVATTDVDNDGLTVSLNMQDPESAIDVIQNLCVAAAGVFYITPDNLYSFRQIDPDAADAFTVLNNDILNQKSVAYDTADVVSSVRVGYARDWVTASNQYTYHTDDSHETSVFTAYRTYNEKTFDTYLNTLTSATNWANVTYPWSTEVHGSIDIQVPIAYYDDVVITEVFAAQLNRPQTTMLGTVSTEIRSISWNLEKVPTITIGGKLT